MYPYDENDNLNNENTENSGNSSVPSDDGSYRMVKPDAGKSFDAAQDESSNHDPGYRDANYTSENTGPA